MRVREEEEEEEDLRMKAQFIFLCVEAHFKKEPAVDECRRLSLDDCLQNKTKRNRAWEQTSCSTALQVNAGYKKKANSSSHKLVNVIGNKDLFFFYLISAWNMILSS